LEPSGDLPEENELLLGRRWGSSPRPYSGAPRGAWTALATPANRGAPPRGVDVKETPAGSGNPKNPVFGQKSPKMPKYGYLPAFSGFLTETASILKIPNRSGFQSKSDFWRVLKSRPRGDPENGDFRENGLRRGLFYINPSRRGPAVSRRGSWKSGGLGALRAPRSGCRARALRDPWTLPGPPGNRGGPPRGVDVKPLAEPGVRTPIPGSGRSGDPSLPPGGGTPSWGWDQAPPGPGVSGTPGSGRSRSRGSGIPGSRKGLPRPRGRGPEGLFYINPSRRPPAVSRDPGVREPRFPRRPVAPRCGA